MHLTTDGTHALAVPKRRRTHHSYDEAVDEPPPLIADEAIEIEAERPAEENEPVERIERIDTPVAPAFEEESFEEE